MGSYPSIVLADSPIRYYRLGEASGTTAYDQSRNLSNGTLHGGITLNQAGALNADTDTSMLFNGSTGYISLLTSGLPTGAAAWSIECWLSLPSLPGAGNFPVAVALGNTGVNQGGGFLFNGDTQKLLLTIFGGVGDVGALSIPANAVFHCVGTYDGTTVKFYVNNAFMGSLTHSLNFSAGAVIGADPDPALFWPGLIDEVALYSAALSATQIKNHYLAGIGALNFPVVPLTTLTRDGRMTTTARDGLSLTTKTRG